jgi:Tol biopolymer transport system component
MPGHLTWLIAFAYLAFSGLSACRGVQDPWPVEFPALSGPYLGQTPPGLTPVRFGPAALHSNGAWWWHSSPGFSPDGMEMYWTKYVPSATPSFQMAFTTGRSGQWTVPDRPSFAGTVLENQPRFSADGNSITYVSAAAPGHIYRVTRTSSGWSQPVSLGVPGLPSGGWGWYYSLAGDGSVYVDGDLGQGATQDLFRHAWNGSSFGSPQPVSVNTRSGEGQPCVAPDESYLIFASNRAGGYGLHDLWIAFRQAGGAWSQPLNMGATVNGSSEDSSPYLTADGLYFFFTAKRSGDEGYTPYWVSTALIDSIRVRAGLRN